MNLKLKHKPKYLLSNRAPERRWSETEGRGWRRRPEKEGQVPRLQGGPVRLLRRRRAGPRLHGDPGVLRLGGDRPGHAADAVPGRLQAQQLVLHLQGTILCGHHQGISKLHDLIPTQL